jgi:hypothetical protein
LRFDDAALKKIARPAPLRTGEAIAPRFGQRPLTQDTKAKKLL